ncbi:MAG: hypothetical protein GDA45_03975 [Chromatiales bacterium]|nr:hypothetical protein [Chromatiales bacterium]
MRAIAIQCVAIVLLCLTTITIAVAHPGRTAADGCHYCRTNCAAWGEVHGTRHCHNGGINKQGDIELDKLRLKLDKQRNELELKRAKIRAMEAAAELRRAKIRAMEAAAELRRAKIRANEALPTSSSVAPQP